MGPRTAVTPSKERKMVSGVHDNSLSSGNRGYYNRRPTLPTTSPVLSNPKSVLKRQIVGDAVGWGFVVRGSKPCHIQAVDPSGPAAAVGVKVRQFVVSVNGLNVLSLDYKMVRNLILTGKRTVVMEIMEESDC